MKYSSLALGLMGIVLGTSAWAGPNPDANASETLKRRQALNEWIQKKDLSKAPALQKALDDKDAIVRAEAVQALGEWRYREAAAKIAALLAQDSQLSVREN